MKLHAGYSFQDYLRDRYDNQLRRVYTGDDAQPGDIVMRARHRVNRWDYHTLYANVAGRFATDAIAHNFLVGVDRAFVDRDNNETARNVEFVTNVFDPVIVPDPQIGTRPEKNTGEETRDSRLLLTGAFFTIDRANSPVAERAGVEEILVQRGLQRNRGFEAAATGLVNDQITLTASATYLDAEYVVDNNPSLVGNRPAGASDIALSLWSEYQIDEGLVRGLSLQGGWFYESDRPVDDANSFDVDAYHRFDLGLKYVMPMGERGGLTYRLTASNVFDETYYKADRATEISVERPREIRLSVQYTF